MEFLQTTSVSFTPDDPIVYPFTVINLSCEYNYMLNPVSHSRKSWNTWLVSGTPKTITIYIYFLMCYCIVC